MTATHPRPTELIFKEFNIGKCKTVRYFQFSNNCINDTPVSETIRLSNNRNFAKSSPTFWLSTRDEKKWIAPNLTGLFATSWSNLYFGDHNRKESLMLFKFSTSNTLTIQFYKGFHPCFKDVTELLKNLQH